MSLDFSRCKLPPFQHQKEDIQTLIDNPYFFITSEMRTGKSFIVINAAQFLFEQGVIDRVLVIAPSPVRDVWYDDSIGEIHKHTWKDQHIYVMEFHAKNREWTLNQNDKPPLVWCVTNYEFVRSEDRLKELLPFCTDKTLLVLDESSFVKNFQSKQYKSCFKLRYKCARVVELNGTPISHSPADLFSQGNILHPSVLDCKFITQYRAEYAEMGPIMGKNNKPLKTPYGGVIQTVTGWKNLDILEKKFAPYTVRRLQKDCLDLPPKLDAVTLTAQLDPATWKIYKQMRDECVAMFEDSNASIAAQAVVKTIRLAQITSGFIGGVEVVDFEDQGPRPDFIPIEEPAIPRGPIVEISREKLDVLLWFLGQRLEIYPNLKIIVWCRFRPELARMLDAVKSKFSQFTIGAIHGGQKKNERLETMQLLHPDSSPVGPIFVGGTFGTGSYGVNFTAANHSVNLSFDYSLGKFLQSGDRVYGPGMIGPAAYFDIVAVGPSGQKTIDHAIVKARRERQDVADWVTSNWIKVLKDE